MIYYFQYTILWRNKETLTDILELLRVTGKGRKKWQKEKWRQSSKEQQKRDKEAFPKWAIQRNKRKQEKGKD